MSDSKMAEENAAKETAPETDEQKEEELFLLEFINKCELHSFLRKENMPCTKCWFDKMCPLKMYHPEEKCDRYWKQYYHAEDGRYIPVFINDKNSIDLDID